MNYLGFANMTIATIMDKDVVASDNEFVKNFVGPVDAGLVCPSGRIYNPATGYFYSEKSGFNYDADGNVVGQTPDNEAADVVVKADKPFPWWILAVIAGTWYITNKG
jgi:hypothetical protein